ncbi:hypothetical protein FS749_008633 [Ceratobasidium sp. UAMH 11750]|nr:hypothetical protein FS749_008633 [Ceratobasidium sp. UAMH 11750]
MTLSPAPLHIAHACSSIAPRQNSVPAWEYVLHWVTEFKGDGQPIVSKRQTWMVMVSGLYQRRSLGFKDHYVFGTAHHSTKLNVFAGKWVCDADLPEVARSDPATDKIIIYTLGTFYMESTIDMLQYYLLMRATRRLALDYKAAIDDEALLLALNAGTNANIHSWHPAAQPPRNTGGKKREASQAAAAGNIPETNMGPLDAEDYVQQPVHDDPLMRRFARELSENGESAKVRGYLASSIHEDYDYQVGS